MRDYFCGWYLKFQNAHQSLALIPAWHITGGERSCSIQVITDDGAWNVPFDFARFQMDGAGVRIGENVFARHGVTMSLHADGVDITGSVRFGNFAPIAYDIMGPFQYVPFMQCRHSVYSMKHRIDGRLTLNGIDFTFENGVGYIEGDRGHSFPRDYVWTQCSFPDGSLMLSVADIPFCGIHFTGVICAIHFRGKEYRLATYLGARAVQICDGKVVIRQGNRTLTVRRLERKGHPLAAPVAGKMSRTIHETAACRAYYHFQIKGKTVFEFASRRAAFEYEYPM